MSPHDAGARSCTYCERYKSMRSNAGRVRQNVATPSFTIGQREFVRWALVSDLICYSCSIPEHLVAHLGVLTQVGYDLRRLGIDRLDNKRGYDPGNLGWCCFPCNKAKSNTFSATEMRAYIGPGIRRAWAERLLAAGVSDPWVSRVLGR